MTVSITPCCKSALERLRCWFLAVVLTFGSLPSHAAEARLHNVRLDAQDDGYTLSADVDFELTRRLEDAVTRGVALYFITEFELTQPRWYWLDEKVVTRTQIHRLSYQALTRQYRVSTGALHQGFASLGEALQLIRRLRNWQVVERGRLKPGEAYVASVRFRLDTQQLPKPFQLSAFGSADWNIESGWESWGMTAEAAR